MAPLYHSEEYLQPPHKGCPGCGLAVALRQFLKALEEGEKVIFVLPVGCAGMIIHLPIRKIRHRGQLMKALSVPFGSTATFAGGVKSALEARGDTETKVVALAGDGATFDIGFQALSSAAERNADIMYVCWDNEAYMNTGNQKSSATPRNAVTTTNPLPHSKLESKKDISLILAAHNIPYVGTATIAYPNDLMMKVRKAKDIKGFRFLHFLSPCPTGWGYRSESTVEVSRLAVQTKVFPIFEVENGSKITINKQTKQVPIEEYVKIQGRFRHLSSEQIDGIQMEVNERWNRLQWLASYQSLKTE